MKHRTNRGFTLIEILIVVAIIGILASIVLVGLNPSKKAANDARRLSDLKQVQNALELFYHKCGYYPVPGAFENGSTCGTFAAHVASGNPTPPDPNDSGNWSNLQASLRSSNIGVDVIPADPVGGTLSYQYAVDPTNGQSYVLKAKMESNPQALRSSYAGASIFGYTFDCDPLSSVTPTDYCVKF